VLAAGRADPFEDDLAIRDLLERSDREECVMTHETMPEAEMQMLARDESTGQLVREALDQTRELVRLEVALARNEVTTELAKAKRGAIALGAAAAVALSSSILFMVALALSFSVPWLAALSLAIVLLLLAGALGFAGYKMLPTRPMAQTKERIEADLSQLKERIA
jgi:hypothetical protein